MRTVAAAVLMAALTGHALAAPPSAQDRLDAMRAEAREAANRATNLERRAERSSNKAEALQARRAALAARIDAIDTELAAGRLEAARLQAAMGRTRAALDAERAPVSALLAGLATQARHPPVLALARSGSLDEMVRTQALIDALIPTIDARTRETRLRAARLERLGTRLAQAQAMRDRRQDRLAALRTDLAAQVAIANDKAASIGVAAAQAGTRALAAEEATASLVEEARREAFGADIASALADYPPAPPAPRPFVVQRPVSGAPFAYRLPVEGRIVAGLGSLDADGVRARGLRMRVARGAPVSAPADGVVRYAGAFRGRDGVIVIDHGKGWHSLLGGVASPLAVGRRVRAGQRIGSASGTMLVELWDGRRPRSPALIAGSS